MKTFIFVHGFGVRQDARGLFTDLATTLTSATTNCVLFDLNTIHPNGDIEVLPFSAQVETLLSVYTQCSDTEVTIIAHSQGCVVAALVDLPITKTIFLAPPTDTNIEKTITYFSQNPATVIDTAGISRLARRDGSTTIVPAAYWQERASLDLPTVYRKYLANHETIVIQATQDEVISDTHFNDIFHGVSCHQLEADHDFTGVVRNKLSSLLKQLLE